MPCCSALKCLTRPGMGKIMHRFPRDPHRRKLWTIKVKRENWMPGNHSYLCSDHFDDGQYESRRADNLRKLKPNAVPTLFGDQVVSRKPLETPRERSSSTDNSKPTNPVERINLEHGYSTKRTDSKTLQVARSNDSSIDDKDNEAKEHNQDNESKEHNQDLTKYSPDDEGSCTETAASDLNMSQENNITKEEVPIDDFDDSQYESEQAYKLQKLKPRKRKSSTDSSKPNSPTKKICLEHGYWYSIKKIDSKEIQPADTKDSSTDEENNELGDGDQDLPNDYSNETRSMTETTAIILNMILEQKLKRQMARISHLTKALKKERHKNRKLLQEKMVLEERLSEVFSPGQLQQLSRRTHRGMKWSDDVIEKALQLRIVCGAEGYQLLLSQGQPLPSMRSLRRKMAMEADFYENTNEKTIENPEKSEPP